MKNLKEKMLQKLAKVESRLIRLRTDENGMEFMQLIIVCLMAIVLGGVLLTFFKDSFNDIGNLMVKKIKLEFSL